MTTTMTTTTPNNNPHQQFWTDYQPGVTRYREAMPGRESFDEIERQRYALEPDIPELAQFGAMAGRDVLEAGCGIGTDGVRFARAGANYTGLDFSPTALEHASTRFELEGLEGRFVEGSVTSLPFADNSFDLVYSMGVVHHVPDTAQAIKEFRRVLRPGGQAIVLVYHRHSFNYYFTILGLKRLLTPLLLIPGASAAISKLTGEPAGHLKDYRQLLREHGVRYLRDRQLFLDNNTDGPGNPLAKVYSRDEAHDLFSVFTDTRTDVRFLHLRSYPAGNRLARTRLGRALGNRWGWHLWITARP